MLAAAVAAIGYLPSRDRFLASATRFVYGAREAPDEVLRTFGNRMTRAVAMDELLLQLAESLRKTMGLASAEASPWPRMTPGCRSRSRSPWKATAASPTGPRWARRSPR
jgi:hypothetical protein